MTWTYQTLLVHQLRWERNSSSTRSQSRSPTLSDDSFCGPSNDGYETEKTNASSQKLEWAPDPRRGTGVERRRVVRIRRRRGLGLLGPAGTGQRAREVGSLRKWLVGFGFVAFIILVLAATIIDHQLHPNSWSTATLHGPTIARVHTSQEVSIPPAYSLSSTACCVTRMSMKKLIATRLRLFYRFSLDKC